MLDLTKMMEESLNTDASKRRICMVRLYNGYMVKCEQVSAGYILTLKNSHGENVSPTSYGFDKWDEVTNFIYKTFDVISHTLSGKYRNKQIPEVGFYVTEQGAVAKNPPIVEVKKSVLWEYPFLGIPEVWEKQTKGDK